MADEQSDQKVLATLTRLERATPGNRHSVNEIALVAGLEFPPVRSALVRLTRRGLVHQTPGGGYALRRRFLATHDNEQKPH
jgi:DNA-binding IclR family transcriptional regulator